MGWKVLWNHTIFFRVGHIIKENNLFVFKISTKNGGLVKKDLVRDESKVEMSSLFTASQCNICGVQIKNQKELSFHILKSHRVFEMYQIHPTVSEEIIECPESVCKDKARYFQVNGALAFKSHRFFECKNKDKNALHFCPR